MIKEGQQKRAKYWGKFIVKKVAQLKHPVPSHSNEVDETLFSPTLVQIEWENGGHEFWFPHWITIKGKERYGQYAPMMSESSLLELLQEGIRRGFFGDNFLHQLQGTITDKLNSK